MFEKRNLQKGSSECPELTYVLMFVNNLQRGVQKTGLKGKRRLARLFPWFQRMNAFSFFV